MACDVGNVHQPSLSFPRKCCCCCCCVRGDSPASSSAVWKMTAEAGLATRILHHRVRSAVFLLSDGAQMLLHMHLPQRGARTWSGCCWLIQYFPRVSRRFDCCVCALGASSRSGARPTILIPNRRLHLSCLSADEVPTCVWSVIGSGAKMGRADAIYPLVLELAER